RSQPPVPRSAVGELGPVCGAGLLEDLTDVELDRVLAEVDLGGDLAIPQAFPDEAEDLDLEPAQREGRRRCPPRKLGGLALAKSILHGGVVDGDRGDAPQ